MLDFTRSCGFQGKATQTPWWRPEQHGVKVMVFDCSEPFDQHIRFISELVESSRAYWLDIFSAV